MKTPARPRRYDPPGFLRDRRMAKAYRRWLHRKAVAHVLRDRRRGNDAAEVPMYKRKIHQAVLNGGKRDTYTGTLLRWDLIGKWNNKDAKAGGRKYKRRFADMPTVDHLNDGMGKPRFRICSWRTNGAKEDLTIKEFRNLCRQVLRHARSR